MRLSTQRYAELSESYAGGVTLIAQTRADAKLLGILSRLIACGTTARDGVEVLLEVVFEKATEPKPEPRRECGK